MDNGMVLAGVFRLKDGASRNAMPAHNHSGLWQAWKTPGGRFMVQPLDQDEKPRGGATYMLEARDFEAMLTSWRVPGEGGDEMAKPGGADEPDILAFWYEQALADQNSRDEEPPFPAVPEGVSSDGRRAGWRAPASGKRRMPPDEIILEPSWNPDEFFFSEEGAAPSAEAGRSPLAETAGADAVSPPPARKGQGSGPDAGAAGVPARSAGQKRAPAENHFGASRSRDDHEDDLFAEVFARERLSSEKSLDFMPALSLDADPRPAPAIETAFRPVPAEAETGLRSTDADRPFRFAASPPMLEVVENDGEDGRAFRDDDAHAEARAQRLEQRMREEFAALLERFDNEPDLDVERDLSRLILRGTGFSWKQKFMFTEFGFAFRRRRLHKLALASHLRALSFSPSDEHALFNVARSEYELGKVEEARAHLAKALEASPAFDAARRFFDFLDGRAKNGA